MSFRRMCVANLSSEGYGHVRMINNVAVTIKGNVYSMQEYSSLLDKIIADPDVRRQL